MITEFSCMVFIIVRDRDFGQTLYEALRAFPNSPLSEVPRFDVELSDGAWAMAEQCTKDFYTTAKEYEDGGHPQALIDLMGTAEAIDAVRPDLIVRAVDLYPDNQTRTVQPNALDDFITANGFTRIEQSP